MKKLVAKVGTYQKDGETKNRYQDVGAIMSNSNGEYALLNPAVNLAGLLLQQNAMSGENRTSVMISVFDNDNRQQPQQQPAQNNSAPQDFEQDAPF